MYTEEHINHMFETYATSRREVDWCLLWSVIGECMRREHIIAFAAEQVNELEAAVRQHTRALRILQHGHSQLYQQAFSSPGMITSAHVRRELLKIGDQLSQEKS